MPTFRTKIPNHFDLPRRIRRLGELAYNLWWTWNPSAQRLFYRIDTDAIVILDVVEKKTRRTPMDAIAACILGGTSTLGGVGTIQGAMIGALIIAVGLGIAQFAGMGVLGPPNTPADAH